MSAGSFSSSLIFAVGVHPAGSGTEVSKLRDPLSMLIFVHSPDVMKCRNSRAAFGRGDYARMIVPLRTTGTPSVG